MEKVKITVDSKIRIDRAKLPEEVIGRLKESLIFENPLYRRNLRYGRPNHNIEPYLFCIWHDKQCDDLIIAKGFLSELLRVLNAHRVEFELEDLTHRLPEATFDFRGSLYGYQDEAMKEISKRRFGVLVGPIGSGKKVMVLKLISMRKTPALVIVRTKRQLYQWKEAAIRFLGLTGEQDIGLIGDGHCHLDRALTISISLSLYKVIDQIRENIGFVIVDQCEAANLKIFFKGVMPLNSKYMLGLACSSKRSDGLTRLMCAYLGPNLHRIRSSLTKFEGLGNERPELRIQNTGFEYDYQDDFPGMISALCSDEKRNRLITADVLQKTSNPGSRVLVISERIGHLQELLKLIEAAHSQGEIIAGEIPETKRTEIFRRFDLGKLQLILVTLKSIHTLEVKKANCLFVASPLKYGDHLTQIIGKLLGTDTGRQSPMVYDYRDEPEILQNSLKRRIKVYRGMGAK